LSNAQQSTVGEFCHDTVAGLAKSPKRLSSKYFYDQRGSELFDQICELDEYYVTRTELAIMAQSAGEMAEILGSNCMLIELGSGSSLKTRILLDHMKNLAAYVPVDISHDHLQQIAGELSELFPEIEVLPVTADFTKTLTLPECEQDIENNVVYFPGSTLGNFTQEQANKLLHTIHDLCDPRGGLLLGIDLQKDPAVIEAAYNDELGVTAEFNLNLLHHINRELDADFQVDQFRHYSFYNQEEGRNEMHLVSRIEQSVTVCGETFDFAKEERICTEYSHKYNVEAFKQFAAELGFECQATWTDPQQMFAVMYFSV